MNWVVIGQKHTYTTSKADSYTEGVRSFAQLIIMTSAALVILLGVFKLMAPGNHTYRQDDNYYILPKFWTSTGFCPAGEIGSIDLKQNLLSDTVSMNLQHIASLPNGAITHIRIHWLLELIGFVQYTQAGVPIYDFDDLDTFIMQLDDLGLYPVIEFMANPGDIFIKNPNQNDFLWENFSFQVTKHYLSKYVVFIAF